MVYLGLVIIWSIKSGPSLVWVLWVLQHPHFLKVWVLAPMVLGIYPSFFIKKCVKNVMNLLISWQKEISSIYSFEFLTGALKGIILDDICCVLVLKLDSIDKITTFYLIFETIFTPLYKESMFYSIEI